MGEPQRILVADWSVLPTRNLLERAGESTKIKPRSMEVLVYLASRAGEVVSTEELIKTVWQGRVVSDGTVYQSITNLRQAFGDSTEAARVIETIPKRGYRLVAPVTVESPSSEVSGARWKPGFAVAAVAMLILGSSFLVFDRDPVVLERSVAVLPFEHLSPDPDDAYFTDGIHASVVTQLSKISALEVISRTSVLEYRDSPRNMRQIGDELGVAAIVEGSVQRAGDDIRINVQLIDAESDEPLWGETYDRELTAENIFAIQSEMATAIAEALEATLLPEEVARLNELPTQNTEAYEFFQRGNAHMDQPWNESRSEEDVWTPLAVHAYEQAVDRDPEFAEAWAALSRAHTVNGDLEMAEAALEEALELAPNSPEVRMAKGRYHFALDEYDQALEEYAIAEQTLPADPRLLRGQSQVYSFMGNLEQAVPLMAKAIELDPLNVEMIFPQGADYMWLREYEQAERHFERVLEIRPDIDYAYIIGRLWVPLGRGRDGDFAAVREAFENPPTGTLILDVAYQAAWTAAIYQRDYDAALGYLDAWDIDVDQSPDPDSPITMYYGMTYQLKGQSDLAEREFLAARAHLEEQLETNSEDHRLLVALAAVLVGLDQNEAALRLADQVIERMATWSPGSGPRLHWREGVARHTLLTWVLAPAQAREMLLKQLDIYLMRPGILSIESLMHDPHLNFIRDDPQFQTLVEKYRWQ